MNDKIIWIDVETTGLDAKNDTIIELAALYEDDRGDKSKDVFHKFCKPNTKPNTWDEKLKNANKTISELTGITWDFLEKNGLSERNLYIEFERWLSGKISKFDKNDKAIFAAYNANFDNRFIRVLFEKNNDRYFGSYFESANLDILSTVAMARKIGILPQLANNQQTTVAKHLGINFKAHSAIEDIKSGRLVQLKLEEKMRNK